MNTFERFKPWLVTTLLISALLLSWSTRAAGLLTPADGSLPALSIRDHQVQVTIEDGFAVTRVDQVFHNPHSVDLEATYSFPVPQHASVAEFTVWIDGKPVNGEVLESKEARRVYEEEKAAGREAGITERDQYKTFDVSVWPVRAGQDTRIRFVYLQPASVDSGIGRYVYPLEEGGVDEQKLAFWTASEGVTGRFSFDLTLKSAYAVDAVRLPNQGQAAVTHQDAGQWRVHLGSDSAPGRHHRRTGFRPCRSRKPECPGHARGRHARVHPGPGHRGLLASCPRPARIGGSHGLQTRGRQQGNLHARRDPGG